MYWLFFLLIILSNNIVLNTNTWCPSWCMYLAVIPRRKLLFKLANFNFTQLSNLVLWLLRMHLTFQRLTCHVQPQGCWTMTPKVKISFFFSFSSSFFVKNYFLNDLNKKNLCRMKYRKYNNKSLYNTLVRFFESWFLIKK